ncbi:MAG: phosphonoacetaldehyde hydrolase [Lachnospiraceae bacterium]|nr:phosphonoacetaldehyde hydrolase [Lachnospiraceae bacterium]
MNHNIELVVFDWAGTTTDFGSQAPVQVFDRTFIQYGMHFSREEINAPMGMEKKAHIRRMLSSESAGQRWQDAHHTTWTEEDVEEIYQSFEENLRQVVAEYSQVISGVPETVSQLRSLGMKIGSTTGYTSEIMQYVLPAAKAGGYVPDCVVTPDIAGGSRPTPFMLFECMRQTGIYPPSHVVKVGDTVVDIQEGKNAGAWSVGILTGSNLMGFSQQEYESASGDEIQEKKARARFAYFEAGADLVIDNIRELPAAIEEINARIRAQEER